MFACVSFPCSLQTFVVSSQFNKAGTFETVWQAKYYNYYKREHCQFGNKFGSIDYECKPNETRTLMWINKESFNWAGSLWKSCSSSRTADCDLVSVTFEKVAVRYAGLHGIGFDLSLNPKGACGSFTHTNTHKQVFLSRYYLNWWAKTRSSEAHYKLLQRELHFLLVLKTYLFLFI